MTLSEEIKNARNKAGLSQKSLADKIHVSQQAVQQWEAGQTSPDPYLLHNLSLELNAPLLHYLCLSHNGNEQTKLRVFLDQTKRVEEDTESLPENTEQERFRKRFAKMCNETTKRNPQHPGRIGCWLPFSDNEWIVYLMLKELYPLFSTSEFFNILQKQRNKERSSLQIDEPYDEIVLKHPFSKDEIPILQE